MHTDLNPIINRCRKQDRQAQQRLYIHYVEQMHNAALRYSKDDADAKDLVHDSFLKIFKGIQNFKGDSKTIFGWMLRILINEALQKYRRAKKIEYVEQLPQTESLDGEEEILSQLASEEIWNLVKQLSEEEQLIINLHLVDQLSHQEISDLLQITPSHSRTRLTRAKKKLKLLILNQYKVRL